MRDRTQIIWCLLTTWSLWGCGNGASNEAPTSDESETTTQESADTSEVEPSTLDNTEIEAESDSSTDTDEDGASDDATDAPGETADTEKDPGSDSSPVVVDSETETEAVSDESPIDDTDAMSVDTETQTEESEIDTAPEVEPDTGEDFERATTDPVAAFTTGGDVRLTQGIEILSDNDISATYGVADSSVPQNDEMAKLVSSSDCDGILDALKEKSLAAMEEAIAIYQSQFISAMQYNYFCDDILAPSGGWFGSDGTITYNSDSRDSAETTQSATEYSTTNRQVVDVDEADFVKNDGSYIYILTEDAFRIIDAWPPAKAAPVSDTVIEGIPKKLYVNNDVAVIYSSLDKIDVADSETWFTSYIRISDDPENECTYGYNCDFSGDGRELKMTVLDIADKTTPQLIREVYINGSYLNSRRVDNAVYTVVTLPENAVRGVSYWPEQLVSYIEKCEQADDFPYSEAEVTKMFESLLAENRAVIETATISDFQPSAKEVMYANDKSVTKTISAGCDQFMQSGTEDGQSFLSLFAFDMSKTESSASTAIIGKPGAVYASSEALYVATRHYQSQMETWFYDTDDADAPTEATTIHKFTLLPKNATAVYTASGVVKGRVLNQFSMDEHNGNLRIATTTGRVPSPDVHSTLTVLTELDEQLYMVGMVDQIAPTEDIRSVRFNGDTGFIVTFKKTDPLFVFDLKDPKDPTITAALKIPGYSTYMHLMDETHLLTMGYDAEDHDDFAYFQGIQLQVIDVSELTNPTLMFKEVIGTRGSTSEAATNHLAFNYFSSRRLLAIPMTICEESSGGGSYGQLMAFSGLLVYQVTAEKGFTFVGGIPHDEPETEETYRDACSNWWTDSNSVVQRSIFMRDEDNDYAFSIDHERINIAELEDASTIIQSIPLIDPAEDDKEAQAK